MLDTYDVSVCLIRILAKGKRTLSPPQDVDPNLRNVNWVNPDPNNPFTQTCCLPNQHVKSSEKKPQHDMTLWGPGTAQQCIAGTAAKATVGTDPLPGGLFL